MPDAHPHDPARQRFLAALQEAVAAQRLGKLVLAKPQGGEPGWQRTLVRLIELRGQSQLQFVHRHATRDDTRNLPLSEGLAEVDRLLGAPFRHAHLQEPGREWQLLLSKKGRGHLVERPLDASADAAPPPTTHNREKHRWVPQDRPWLTALGVTDAQQRVLPTMAAKWRQINRFVEVFAQALAKSPLKDAKALSVVDFGAGRGYLTFAVADWLAAQGVQADVCGVELRPALVAQCNTIVQRHGPAGLRFDAGDLNHESGRPPRPMNVMIALHACDTATDGAMALGVRAGADILLCSPCCHKQVRPQLLAPGPLKPVLAHGIHADEQAEMLTDALRALLLEAAGYDTQVFEFVSLEHTAKNKMILAVKRAQPRPAAPLLAQVDELKRFFGIREQALEAQLRPWLQAEEALPSP